MSIHNIIRKAVEEFGAETRDLEFLPENRYNKRMFPTTGQYDWFSGEVLYCLIRFLKPMKILEISMASGYSTMFMAMAVKRNSWGTIDSFELDSKVEKAAARLFNKCAVDKLIRSYVGDARKKSVSMPSDYGIYFLDSLHTEDFARWFIDTHVMRAQRTDALFHMHDIMPLHARVRRWNRPPFDRDEFEEKSKQSWLEKIKEKAAGIVHPSRHSQNRAIPIQIYPAEETGGLQTFDGNCTTEAIWGTMLAGRMNSEDHVFLHDVANQYPQLTPRKYDHVAVGRTDSRDVPMEWNETWWCKVAAFKKMYRRFKEEEEKVDV